MNDSDTVLNTHTLYNYYARQLQQANEAIAQTSKYLDPASEHYLPAYIERLEALQAQDDAPADIAQKIANARGNWERYQQRAAEARHIIAEYPQKIQALEQDNAVFQAPAGKQNEYLFVMDDETCRASCVDWEGVVANVGQAIVAEQPEQFVFSNKRDIALTGEHQTDALRVWNNNVCVQDLCIQDDRCYTEAHRDAIQLIPPPLHRFEDGEYIRLADQMAGAILENVTVERCEIRAPNGPLQGIFASDGMYRNLIIRDNDISTMGSHSISIAGLLNGGEISGNTLREVEGGQLPEISLYPARIGGNMADDGVVSILSFAEQATSGMAYEPVTVTTPNKRIRANGVEEALNIRDLRDHLPDNFLRMGVALQAFDFEGYLADYSALTLGEYRQHDPFGAKQMEAWLALRTQEFLQGREADHPLGQPSHEQQVIAERFLTPALAAMRDGSVDDVRLVDLEYTAIRSFAMKRLAIMHASPAPLIDLALANTRRELMLNFLLEPEQLQQKVRIAHLSGQVCCQGSGQAVPYLKYTVFFAPDQVYQGSTDANGTLSMEALPLGPYVLSLNTAGFAIAGEDEGALAATPVVSAAAEAVAGSLLADFARKLPVVKAWLMADSAHETQALSALQRYLNGRVSTADAEVPASLRQACLHVMGYGKSWREPYRQDRKLVVHCPSVKPQAGGCLFVLMNLLRRWLKI